MNLGVPLKYAGEAGTIRAGMAFLSSKFMGGAAFDSSKLTKEAALEFSRLMGEAASGEAREDEVESSRRWGVCEAAREEKRGDLADALRSRKAMGSN